MDCASLSYTTQEMVQQTAYGLRLSFLHYTRNGPADRLWTAPLFPTLHKKWSNRPPMDCASLSYTTQHNWFLDAFQKFAKIGYQLRHVCLSVCSSVRTERHGSTGGNYINVHSCAYVDNLLMKFKFQLKSDNNNRYFT